MSGSILIQPRVRAQKSVYSSTPSIFRDIFEEVFNTLPYTLTRDDSPILYAMAVLSEKQDWANKHNGKPWRDLYEAVNKYGEVEIRMEY